MKTTTIIAALALSVAIPSAVPAQEAAMDLSEAFSAAGALSKNSDSIAVPAPVQDLAAAPAVPGKAAARKWTIMVYVDGKNSLEKFIYTNLRQMEKLGSTDKVNVVVEVGRMNGQSDGDFHGDGDWTGCRRYLVQKTDKPGAGISSPILQTIPDCDMGDYNHAIDFGKWAMQNYPAQHYMYVLWNHGGGWFKTTPGFTNTKVIAYDDQTKHVISTPQMAKILKALGHVDVYGSDACLMQMAEVAFEIRGLTDFIVGSEKTEPGSGWDYAAFLKTVYASGMSPLEVANAVVDTYTPQYSAGATLSTIRSSALDGFVDKLNSFVGAVQTAGEVKVAAAARDAALNFKVPAKPGQENYEENKDLYDFLALTAAGSKSDAVKAAARDLMAYIDGKLVADNKVSPDFAKAHGVAIYAPAKGFNRDYNELLFNASQWPALVKAMQK